MHVVYDHQIFALQEFGGISRYFVELAKRLQAGNEGIETTVLAPLHVNDYLASASVRVMGRRIPVFRGKHRILPFCNHLASRFLFGRLAPDILHETYYSAHPLSVKVPRILSVYDMIHERFPELFQGPDRHIPQVKAMAVARADHIIAISRSTRDDLINYLDVAPEKITVIPLASAMERPAGDLERVGQPKPYLLYVGLREGVKNFATFLEGYGHSRLLPADFDILCVGGGPFTVEEQRRFEELGIGGKVQQLQADDHALATLYSQAALFVYPSLYEGFGLPLLEAMRCGCPVACSNTGSMPEIAGEAAIYFEPDDEESLRVALEETLQSAQTMKEQVQRGYEREKLFSWSNCCAQTADLYRSIL